MVHVIPTIYSTTKKEFLQRLEKLSSVSKYLQVDFMDGLFVKKKSPPISQISNLKKLGVSFEAHLMVKNPSAYIGKLMSKGFSKIIFHYESLKNDDEVLLVVKKIRSMGMKSFLAINPSTNINSLLPFIKKVDGFLLMGVNPGLENQKLLSSTISRIKTLRRISKKVVIQVDGGVTTKNIKSLVNAGVDIVNSGSEVYSSDNPRETMKKLESYF